MTSVLISWCATLRGAVRSRAALHFEVVALRHQVRVLQRSRPRRVHLTKADQWLWAWLSRSWSGWRTTLVIVKAETVIAWHLSIVLGLEESPPHGCTTASDHEAAPLPCDSDDLALNGPEILPDSGKTHG